MHIALSWWLAPAIIGLVLLLIVAVLRSRGVRHAYEAHFRETRRERLFLSSIGFFVAVAVVRGLTWAIHNGVGPFHDVSMGGRHIHHLVWGILLLLSCGYLWMLEVGTGDADSIVWPGRIMCLLYGVGSALTLDEFALWLNLRDVYWEREGRASFEALGMFGAALAIGILSAGLIKRLTKEKTGTP